MTTTPALALAGSKADAKRREFENRSRAHTRHGHTKGHVYTPTYISWTSMRSRCALVERDVDRKYAARGISVCPEWDSFERFLADMGERPAGTTLDRYPDINGNYRPDNCRWATPIEQARNRRNARLTYADAVQVALMRLRGVSCREIARRYSCSESLPREIVKGRTWQDAAAEARNLFARESVGA